MTKHKETKLKADMARAQKSIDAATNSLELIAEVRTAVQGLQKNQKLVNNTYKSLLVAKLTSELISDIAKAYPPTGTAMEIIDAGASLGTRMVLRTADAVEFGESPALYVGKQWTRKIPIAGNIAVGALDLKNNIADLRAARDEGDDIIEITDENMKSQERLIEKLKVRLDTSTYRLMLLKKLGSEIDKACG